jgi:hypothetical protein
VLQALRCVKVKLKETEGSSTGLLNVIVHNFMIGCMLCSLFAKTVF